jgi:hypothetical protein
MAPEHSFCPRHVSTNGGGAHQDGKPGHTEHSPISALRPKAEPEPPHPPGAADLPSFDSGPRCASFRGTASNRTSRKDHRASPCGHSLRRRTTSSLISVASIAGASAGIRCPSRNRDSAPSLLTFVLALLASHQAHYRNPAPTTANQQGRHGEILSLRD